MQLFARVVESGSFTVAAGQTGMSRAMASKLVRGLEDGLGVRLLNRSTRRLSLTEPGERYYRRIGEVLLRLAEAEAEAAQLQIEPRGRLRVSAPISFSVFHLSPAVAEFKRRHPRVELQIDLSDDRVDLIDDRYDLAVRISRLADSSLVARKLAPCRMCLVAAPDYLARHGEPAEPADLAAHQCLRYTLTPRTDDWDFFRDDAETSVRVSSEVSVNSGDFIAAAAVAGLGIARLPTFIVAEALRQGRLRRVLKDWQLPSLAIYAVYPQTSALPAKTRSLIDFLAERFGDHPYWDRDLP
jgi:DNA-binding transcriptional LysR family regulator